MAKKLSPKVVETLTHEEASRRNIPTAEHETVMETHSRSPIEVAYQRRNRDLDPQLVWRGKDLDDWSDLVVQAPPLFIQEKVHPKVLIDDLLRHSMDGKAAKATDQPEYQPDLFSDFNGLPNGDARMEFYQHDANWANRMILGDSLQVMASLAEREGLRGKVQCIYIDPPYGIKFNSNFQWSTTSRAVKDGKAEHITREPEQVKAFRDTWRDGIHSYLTYLRDRLTVARDLLTDSGSIFVQIGDENIHRVRVVMDEVFGESNHVSTITVRKTTSEGSTLIGSTTDFVLWYGRNRSTAKFRPIFKPRSGVAESRYSSISIDGRRYRLDNITSSRPAGEGDITSFKWNGRVYSPGRGTFKTTLVGLRRLSRAGRLYASIKGKLNYVRFRDDFSVAIVGNLWNDISGAVQSRSDPKVYVVQTSTQLVRRCILMTTDPGDLVLDPTCGAGTTAFTAEQWGRRWITIDTSRVALALARVRIMGARYPYYILADSLEGQRKQAEVTGSPFRNAPTHGSIRLGFIYQRVPHITLKMIANNADIDVIWEKFQKELEPIRLRLNHALRTDWKEWEVPRSADSSWSSAAQKLQSKFWKLRIARQREIDTSVTANGDFEYLCDKPHEDKRKVRVSGPFTVESITPHRVIGVDEEDDLIAGFAESRAGEVEHQDFIGMVLEHLRTSHVQQVDKADRLSFSSLKPWPGDLVCAEAYYVERTNGDSVQKRAGIFVGSEFGTVSRTDLVEAAREAAESGFQVLVACAFSYDARASDFNKLGRIPVLKARMNADLHMAGDLKNTGKGNLFVIFGEPDIAIIPVEGNRRRADQIRVKINGVDVFHPNTGEIRSHNTDGIACWFIDTNYDHESFFVRHAYFLGTGDTYKTLRTTLKTEISKEAWSTLRSDISRPFARPESGRIAVKVINHLGDEVMKVFRV